MCVGPIAGMQTQHMRSCFVAEPSGTGKPPVRFKHFYSNIVIYIWSRWAVGVTNGVWQTALSDAYAEYHCF